MSNIFKTSQLGCVWGEGTGEVMEHTPRSALTEVETRSDVKWGRLVSIFQNCVFIYLFVESTHHESPVLAFRGQTRAC